MPWFMFPGLSPAEGNSEYPMPHPVQPYMAASDLSLLFAYVNDLERRLAALEAAQDGRVSK